MSPISVFYAQPVDFVSFAKIKENIERFRDLTREFPIEIVAPYLDEQPSHNGVSLDRRLAQLIVEKAYAALDACDILLVDFSQEDRQAIGMVFEMAYAWSKGKTIVVYTGGSSLGRRVWTIAASDCICQTWTEVKDCIEKHLDSFIQAAA